MVCSFLYIFYFASASGKRMKKIGVTVITLAMFELHRIHFTFWGFGVIQISQFGDLGFIQACSVDLQVCLPPENM